MHFTLRQIQTFTTVARTASFARAADHLSLSPSAVSQLVSELESLLGYKLFDRSTRKVVLSSAGRTLLPSALSLVRQAEDTRTLAGDIRNQTAGLVRVAAPMVIAGALLPRLVAEFRRSRPRLAVRLVDCPVEGLVEKVAMREVDLAVGPDRPVDAAIRRVMLYPSPWVVWCAASHPLARRRRDLVWADLVPHNLVTAGRDHEIYLTAIVERLPDNARVAPEQVVDHISTALGLTATGLWYTLAPAYVEALALPLGLVMRRLSPPLEQREVSLFEPVDQTLSPAANAFAMFLKEHLEMSKMKI